MDPQQQWASSPLQQANGGQQEKETPPHHEQPKFLPNWDSADMAMCNSPGNAMHYLKRSKRRNSDSTTRSFRSWIVDHQVGLSLNALTLLTLTHLLYPRARPHTRPFFTLAYHHPDSNTYHQGPEDFFYVITWIVLFTGLRAAVMTYVLLPCAELAGLRKVKTKVRFAEQAWLLLYYSVFWSLGMYLWTTSKYWLNFRELWTDFPARLMSATMKWYYLVQFAFWIQQIVVVNIEERRKDHWQMFTHHIVTCALILTSLGYNQMRVGNVILCIMDVVDLVFPAAKMLKYTGHQTLCDLTFGLFILTWTLFRHIIYMFVVWSIYSDTPIVMVPGTYSSATGELLSPIPDTAIWSNVFQPYLDPQGPVSYHLKMKYAFLIPLLVLQGITVMWFAMICRVAWGVIKGEGAGDSRSDDEEEDEVEAGVDEEVKAPIKSGARHQESKAQAAVDAATEKTPVCAAPVSMKPIEVEVPQEEYVGVEELNLRRRGSPRYAGKSRKSAAGSGLAFTGHSDRKELLGRIGCDKPS